MKEPSPSERDVQRWWLNARIMLDTQMNFASAEPNETYELLLPDLLCSIWSIVVEMPGERSKMRTHR